MRFVDPKAVVERLHINPGLVVADLGAGSGFYTFAIAERVGENGCVYAIDIQRDMIRAIANQARAAGVENIETLWGDIDESNGIPLPAGSVDLAILSNTLFQLDNPERAFAEAARIIKTKGRLVVIEWSESFAGIGPTADQVVSSQRATSAAEDAGLIQVESFEPGAHHYGILYRKS